ncbi:MAG: hypothetical protein WBV41_08025, partial [Terriglobales bacterium]
MIVPLVTYSFGCFWQAHESQWREIKSKSKAAGGGARSTHSLFTIDIPMTQALLKGKYEFRGEGGIHSTESGTGGLGEESRRLSLAVGRVSQDQHQEQGQEQRAAGGGARSTRAQNGKGHA